MPAGPSALRNAFRFVSKLSPPIDTENSVGSPSSLSRAGSLRQCGNQHDDRLQSNAQHRQQIKIEYTTATQQDSESSNSGGSISSFFFGCTSMHWIGITHNLANIKRFWPHLLLLLLLLLLSLFGASPWLEISECFEQGHINTIVHRNSGQVHTQHQGRRQDIFSYLTQPANMGLLFSVLWDFYPTLYKKQKLRGFFTALLGAVLHPASRRCPVHQLAARSSEPLCSSVLLQAPCPSVL